MAKQDLDGVYHLQKAIEADIEKSYWWLKKSQAKKKALKH